MTLNEACERYRNYVYRYCLHELYLNEENAEDVTQETFKALIKNWDKLDHDNFEPWLKKVSENQVKKLKASYTKRKAVIVDTEEELADPSTNAEMYSQVICRKVDERLEEITEEILSELSERDRVIAEGIRNKTKYADIAEQLNTTEGAIAMAAVRLNRKVRELVEKKTEEIF